MCLSNHLEFHGSLLAQESSRETEATKLCNKHILEFTNLPWTLRRKIFGCLLKHTLLQDGLAIQAMNNAHPTGLTGCGVTFQSSVTHSLCEQCWGGLDFTIFGWNEPKTNTKPVLVQASPRQTCAADVALQHHWSLGAFFSDLWLFFLPTRLILSFFAMYVNSGKIIA